MLNSQQKEQSIYSNGSKMYSEIRSKHSFRRSTVKSVVASRKSLKTPTLPNKEDLDSVITKDNLKKFNDALDIQDELDQKSIEDQNSIEDVQVEEVDDVTELKEEQPMDSISQAVSQAVSAKKSGISNVSKMYITKLE